MPLNRKQLQRVTKIGLPTVFAVVMYVFQFVESMLMLPFFYQEWLRLREISGRLAAAEAEG